jgi:hypothetical protein
MTIVHQNDASSRAFFRGAVVTLVVTLLVSLAPKTFAQEGVATIKVGRFWAVQTEAGALGPVNFSAGWWPGDFDVVAQETHQGSSATGIIYLLTGEWETPDGEILNKVVNGLKSVRNTAGTVIEPQRSYVRYPYPSNTQQLEQYRPNPIGEVNPEKLNELCGTCSQAVTVTNEYIIGVQAQRNVYAWTQDNHDDYIVNEIVFENVTDETLDPFWIYMSITIGDFEKAFGNNPSPGRIGDQNDHWAHYYGGAPSDSQRVYYWYHADDPRDEGDNMGNPALGQDGRLVDFQMGYYSFLHTSGEPYVDPADDVNDPIQPRVTFTGKGSIIGLPEPRSRYGIPLDNEVWYDGVTGDAADPLDPGATEETWHQRNSDEIGSDDWTDVAEAVVYSGSPPAQHSTLGPYTFEPGEKIRLVYIVGSQGIGVDKAIEVGRQLKAGTVEPPPNLPDPNTGYFPENFVFPNGASQQDIYKDLWLSTGIDSVHTSVYNARWNFMYNWSVPEAPPPPSMDVKGFPDNVTITWSNPEVENDPNFAGYRVLRRISMLDTTRYEVVHKTGPEETGDEHEFQDTEVQFGASYSYYVQAGVRVDENHPTALSGTRGTILWSGRTYLPTPTTIEPPRGGTETLSDVTIAPNPYNINDPVVHAQGWVDNRGILFFNLPSRVTIDIYAENGDHVKTIEHDSPVGKGSLRWDMITKNEQIIASGVYIATFTDDNGNVALRKFVVVR